MAISNLIYETNVSERFELEVLEGAYMGTYSAKKFVDFDNFESFVDRSTEFYGVDQFVLGDKLELILHENQDPNTFNLVINVYKELGGDGQIVFRWFVIDASGVETSVLGDDYQLNLNTRQISSGLESKLNLSFEIKKREEQNKFNTRIDTTIDLFAGTNLDDNSIIPVSTDQVYFKKIDDYLKNKWNATRDFIDAVFIAPSDKFLPRVSPFQIEFDNAYDNLSNPLFVAAENYQGLSLRILNLNITYRQDVNNPLVTNNFKLVYIINTISTPVEIEASTIQDLGSFKQTVIDIQNKTIELPNLNQGDLIRVFCLLDNDSIPNNSNFTIPGNFQYELILNKPEFAIKNNSVRLFNALDKIIEQYTDNQTSLDSDILSVNGRYYENYINSFIGLRPNITNQTLKTNFELLFKKGVSKIMALGYDLRSNEIKVEDINFFFKNIEIFDFSNRKFESESFIFNQYNDIHFNALLTGYKKYSTENNEDLDNFNTVVELTTPIISLKNKLDVQSEVVTDEYVIDESVNDNSSSTNDKDDDVILINSVNLETYNDTALYSNTEHINDGGELVLQQWEKSFTDDFETGDVINIVTGLNIGIYTISSLSFNTMNLGLQAVIQTGISNNTIEITRQNIIKNRTNEGFDILTGVNDVETSSNAIHNPIYQLLRWFPIWGSGLTKKDLSSPIIVNDYKNNGDVTIQVNPVEFPDEFQSELTLNENLTLQQIQDNGLLPLFSGDYIEITINYVTFFEFFEIFNNWRYGVGNDDNQSFGYFTVNTPLGIQKIFPWGEDALRHNRGSNSFTIKGLVKFEI